MKYMIREKFWGWGDDFFIMNDRDEKVFFVDGKAFSWGDKLSFQDLEGNQLAFIKQKLIALMPRYQIFKDGALFAEVQKKFTWFKKKFELNVPGPNDYVINGSFWDHEYTFTRGDRVVASVSRSFFSLNHTYGVQIVDGEDDVAILCTCIVIDQVLHDEDD